MNEPKKFSQAREQHQERLANQLNAARQRGQVGYIGGYCNDSRCPVRDVMYRVKETGVADGVKESRCPSCRTLLMMHSDEFRFGVLTRDEFRALQQQEARTSVSHQLKREAHGDAGLLMSIAEFMDDVSLDQLSEQFANRGAK